MELILNNTLSIVENTRSPSILRRDLNEKLKGSYLYPDITIESASFDDTADFCHLNYLEYLKHCWGSHLGVKLAPHNIWQVMLSELSRHIIDNSEYYRNLFTESNEKVNISIPGDKYLDLNLITEELKKLVPTDVSLFLPELSTHTEMSKLTCQGHFAEAMTPYYDYMVFACGIPKIEILGTDEDWNLIIDNCKKLSMIVDKASEYLNRISSLANKIKTARENEDIEFFKNILRIKHCGSGSQEEIYGWITELYMEVCSLPLINNFPKSVAKVPFKQLETGKDYILYAGLFSSNIDDNGYLIPRYDHFICEE